MFALWTVPCEASSLQYSFFQVCLFVFLFSELTVDIISLRYLIVLSFFVHFPPTDFLALTCSLGVRGAHGPWVAVGVSLFPYLGWGLTSTNRSVQRPLLTNLTQLLT